MKKPWEWMEADLSALIANGLKESIELDYKACDALGNTDGKKNEISKDVSAFANSAGGTIVYGMIEDKHVPVRLDDGYDPTVISKEWLDQVINSRIQRRIDGVRINQVALTGAKVGKVAYVVWTPQSMRAPHQAADKKFYKRLEFQSVPMEEYEVRDASRRGEAPELQLDWQIPKPVMPDQRGRGEGLLQLQPIISNHAVTPAEYVVAQLFIDSELEIKDRADLVPSGVARFALDGQLFSCLRLNKNWGVPAMLPIFQHVQFNFIRGEGLTLAIHKPGRYALGSRLNSPRMMPKVSGSILSWDGQRAVIEAAHLVPGFV